MKIVQILPNVRVKLLGESTNFDCNICRAKTNHYLYKSRPLKISAVVVAITPVPVPIPIPSLSSLNYDILYICEKCNGITKIADASEKKDILEKCGEMDIPYAYMDLRLLREVCDLCCIEESEDKNRFTEPKHVTRHGAAVFYFCDKHKDWLKTRKISYQELLERIHHKHKVDLEKSMMKSSFEGLIFTSFVEAKKKVDELNTIDKNKKWVVLPIDIQKETKKERYYLAATE